MVCRAYMKPRPKLTQKLAVKSLKVALKGVLEAAGYRYELRRNGELKVGLWRRTFKTHRSKSAHSKRFVIVPGFGDSPMSWLPIVGALSPLIRARFDEIVILDFPGFSGWLAEDRPFHSMDLLLGATSDILDELRPHTIFGHSLGGWLTGRYAADCGRGVRGFEGPERVILACPTGVWESLEARDRWEHIFRNAQKNGFGVFRPYIFEREPVWFPIVAPELERFLAREETLAFINSVHEGHGLKDKLSHFKAETWLVFGENDPLAPVSAIPEWARLIEGSGRPPHAVVIKNCGHSIQLERGLVTIAVLGQILLDRKPHVRGSRFYDVA